MGEMGGISTQTTVLTYTGGRKRKSLYKGSAERWWNHATCTKRGEKGRTSGLIDRRTYLCSGDIKGGGTEKKKKPNLSSTLLR